MLINNVRFHVAACSQLREEIMLLIAETAAACDEYKARHQSALVGLQQAATEAEAGPTVLTGPLPETHTGLSLVC